MSDQTDLESRLIRLETRIDILQDKVLGDGDDKKPSFLASLFTAKGLRDLAFLLGLPVATVIGYEKFDSKVLNPGKYREIAERGTAIDKVTQLQQLNGEIYVLQAEDKDNVAYAKIEARRGQVQRLTGDLYDLWRKYPDVFGLHESYAVAEALLLQGRTDDALAVLDSVDTAPLDTIGQVDHQLLRARILFAAGPAQDPEAARDALRAAVDLAGTIEREGQRNRMYEKLVSVRLINELWLGTDCADTQKLGEGLREMTDDDMPAEAADPTRLNTLAVLAEYDRQCPPS